MATLSAFMAKVGISPKDLSDVRARKARQTFILGRHIPSVEQMYWKEPLQDFKGMKEVPMGKIAAKVVAIGKVIDGIKNNEPNTALLAMNDTTSYHNASQLFSSKGDNETVVPSDLTDVFIDRFRQSKGKKVLAKKKYTPKAKAWASPSITPPPDTGPPLPDSPKLHRPNSSSMISFHDSSDSSIQTSVASSRSSVDSLIGIRRYTHVTDDNFMINGFKEAMQDCTIRRRQKLDSEHFMKKISLEAALAGATKRVDQFEVDEVELKKKFAHCTSERDHLVDQYKTVSKALDEKTYKHQNAIKVNSGHVADKKKLKSKIGELQGQLEDQENLKTMVAELQKELTKSKKEESIAHKKIHNLQTQLDDKTHKVTETQRRLRNQVHAKDNDAQNYAAQIMTLSDLNASLNNELLKVLANRTSIDDILEALGEVKKSCESTRDINITLRTENAQFRKELREINYIQNPYQDNLNCVKERLYETEAELNAYILDKQKAKRCIDFLTEKAEAAIAAAKREHNRASAVEKALIRAVNGRADMIFRDISTIFEEYHGLPDNVHQQLRDLFQTVDEQTVVIEKLTADVQKGEEAILKLTTSSDTKHEENEKLRDEIREHEKTIVHVKSKKMKYKNQILAHEMNEDTFQKLADHWKGQAEMREYHLRTIEASHKILFNHLDGAMSITKHGKVTLCKRKIKKVISGLTLHPREQLSLLRELRQKTYVADQRYAEVEKALYEKKKDCEKAIELQNTLWGQLESKRIHYEHEREEFKAEKERLHDLLEKRLKFQDGEYFDLLEQQAKRYDAQNKGEDGYEWFNRMRDFEKNCWDAPHTAEYRYEMVREHVEQDLSNVRKEAVGTYDTTEEGIMRQRKSQTVEQFEENKRAKREKERLQKEYVRQRVNYGEELGCWGKQQAE